MIAKAYGDHAEQNFGEHFGDLLDAVMADFRSASIGISAALAAEGLVVVKKEELDGYDRSHLEAARRVAAVRLKQRRKEQPK